MVGQLSQLFRSKQWLSVISMLMLMLLPVMTVLAAVRATPATITASEDVYTGINYSPSHNTFFAHNRHWVFWAEYEPFDPAEFMYSTSTISGAIWTDYVLEANVNNFRHEISVWYDVPSDTVHYVRVSGGTGPAGVDQIMYRMGDPNDDGTITWHTPAEVLIWNTLDTNVAPINHHVSICVDEMGYPWVAYIDDTGGADDGLVYVVSSSTNDGTFTPDVSDDFAVGAEQNAEFVSITPLATIGDIIHVGWSSEDTADSSIGLYGVVYNVGTLWGGVEIVVADGGMHPAYPYAFSFYDMVDTEWVAFTDITGDVLVRERNAASWNISGAAVVIKNDGLFHVPTISGYRTDGVGEDLIVIVHSATGVLYEVYDYGTTTWGLWNLIWVVPTPATNVITSHVAAYKCYSPLGFAWQYTPIPPALGDDIVHYWWIDNSNDTLGYYPDAANADSVGSDILRTLLPIVVAAGIIIMALGVITRNMMVVLEGLVVGVVGFGIIQALLAVI